MVGDDLGHLVLSHPGEAEHPDLRSEVENLMVQKGFVDDHCDCDDNDVVENRRWVQDTQSQTSHPITDPAVEARAKRYVIIILFL